MSAFEQELHDAFNESEKIESTAKKVENRIKVLKVHQRYFLIGHMEHLLMVQQWV